MEPKQFSSGHILNEVLTITSETSSSEDCFETKLQAKFDNFDNFLTTRKRINGFRETTASRIKTY